MRRARVTAVTTFTAWLLAGWALGCGSREPVASPVKPATGLEVVAVEAGYPGARAGLIAGDRILDAGPPPETAEEATAPGPVDWAYLEAEAGTLGPVAVRVERDGRTLELELAPSPWGVEVAPPLPAEVRAALDDLRRPGDLPATALPVEGLAVEGLASLRRAAAELEPAEAAWIQLEIARAAGADKPLRDEALDAATEAAGRAGDPATEAWAWWRRGDLLWRANAHPPAQEAYARAAELLPDRPLAQAAVLIRRGISLFNSAPQDQAQADLERAAARVRSVNGASTSLAQALNLIAQCQANRSQSEAAEQNLIEAREILDRLDPRSPLRAQLEYQFGQLAVRRGDLAEAGHRFDAAMAGYTVGGVENRDTGNALMGMSSLASVRGDLESAEVRCRAALAIFEREAAGSPHHIWALRSLADIVIRRGQPSTAQALLTRALELAADHDGGKGASSAEVHWSLAEMEDRLGDLDAAVEHYRRALGIFEAQHPQSRVTASLRTELGRTALESGDRDAARVALDAAIERWGELAPGGLWDGWSHYQRGLLASGEGRPAEALTHLRRARESFHRLAPDTVAEAEILHATAIALRQAERPDQALASFAEAVATLERQLPRLGSPEIGAEERARHRALYDDYLDLLVTTGRTGEAFHLLERSRARALLAMLAERDLVFRSALPPELDRERRSARAAHAQALEGLTALSEESPAELVAEAASALRRAQERQEQVRREIRRQSPRLADLSDPRPLTWQGAAEALDPGTLALSFHVGAERMRLFVLAHGGPLRVETVEIGRHELAARVDHYRLQLQAPTPEPDMSEGEAEGRALSDLLLAPVTAELAAAERLLVVPDAALHRLPFAALPAPGGGAAPPGDRLADPGTAPAEPVELLAARLPVHLVSSVTLFSELAGRRRAEPPPGGSVVVAFGAPDLRRGAGAPLRGRHGDELPPLAAARREVESIAKLFGPEATVFTGNRATEARAKATDSSTRYLHFATHALLDERFPLDSALLLAPGSLDAGEDGLLQAWEIFEDLVLDADLVTLSACESALGAEVAGEGLVGLTRAFQYAGARSVLASLWPVSDRSTARLMERFYQGLREGLSKDEALRRAQLHLIQEPRVEEARDRWPRLIRPLATLFGPAEEPPPALDASAPRHWAAFQIYGDWR